MTMKPTQNTFKRIIAFEVAKHELVIHALPGDRQVQIENSKAQIRRHLKAEMKAAAKKGAGPLLVVCEATG